MNNLWVDRSSSDCRARVSNVSIRSTFCWSLEITELREGPNGYSIKTTIFLYAPHVVIERNSDLKKLVPRASYGALEGAASPQAIPRHKSQLLPIPRNPIPQIHSPQPTTAELQSLIRQISQIQARISKSISPDNLLTSPSGLHPDTLGYPPFGFTRSPSP